MNSLRSTLFSLCILPFITHASWFTISTENLPQTLLVGQSYSDIAFIIKNTSDAAIKMKTNIKQAPNGFKIENAGNHCNTTLAAGDSCSIIGSYSPLTVGNRTVHWKFIIADDFYTYPESVARKVSDSITPTHISAKVLTPLPAELERNKDYTFSYKFRDNGQKFRFFLL